MENFKLWSCPVLPANSYSSIGNHGFGRLGGNSKCFRIASRRHRNGTKFEIRFRPSFLGESPMEVSLQLRLVSLRMYFHQPTWYPHAIYDRNELGKTITSRRCTIRPNEWLSRLTITATDCSSIICLVTCASPDGCTRRTAPRLIILLARYIWFERPFANS